MNKAGFLPIFAALLLASCGGGNSEPTVPERPPLEGASIGGPFTLTGSDGKPVSFSDFDGKYRIVYFGYTYCPDVCPIDMQKISAGLQRFTKAHPQLGKDIQPIFISVDPERDTPKVVGDYVNNFGNRWVGLTGTPDEIKKVADQFAVYYAKEEGSGPDDYLMSHSQTPYLLGREGQPLAILPVDEPSTPDTDEGSAQAIAAELERWVQ